MKKTGTIEAWNISPKGFYEGFLLKTGKKLSQVNLPKDETHTWGAALHPGDQVAIEVDPEPAHGELEHAVFRLSRLRTLNGQSFLGHSVGAPRFTGRIKTLNYALHGEVNGGILDSGDFLHLKPEGARAVALKIGLKVEGHGISKPMVGGHSVIEAEEVNGVAIHRHKASKKKHSH
jgi:hypothetical protein